MPLKHLEESSTLNSDALEYINRAAERGLYEIRGLGAKRKLPTFDDLVFLTASLSRYPLEGYRERCVTRTILGTRYAKKPIELAIPITIAGMSFGALSARCQGGDRPRCYGGRHFNYHWRRRHDGRGARLFEDPGLPMFAFTLWVQP